MDGFFLCPPLDDLCFTFFDVFTDSALVLALAALGIEGREKDDWLLSGGLDLELAVSTEEEWKPGGEKEKE